MIMIPRILTVNEAMGRSTAEDGKSMSSNRRSIEKMKGFHGYYGILYGKVPFEHPKVMTG